MEAPSHNRNGLLSRVHEFEKLEAEDELAIFVEEYLKIGINQSANELFVKNKRIKTLKKRQSDIGDALQRELGASDCTFDLGGIDDEYMITTKTPGHLRADECQAGRMWEREILETGSECESGLPASLLRATAQVLACWEDFAGPQTAWMWKRTRVESANREAEQEDDQDSDYFVRELELENDAGSMSFYQKEIGEVNCVVYDSALVLGKYLEKKCLENENYLSGKRILELGSGLGCVGLIAAAYGGKVILTDLPKALPLLELNVRKNERLLKTKGGTADVRALDWNSEDDSLMEPFDVIVAADCVYYEEGVLGLVNTILRLSTPQTEIYLSQENRSYSDKQNQVWNYFCDEVLKHFTVKIIPGSQQHEDYKSGDIYIIQLTKPE